MNTGLIVFDLDGTLVDSSEDLAAAINHARSLHGLDDLAVYRVREYIGDGLGLLLQRSFADRPDADLARARADFLPYYAAHCCDRTRLYPGVRDMLDELIADGWCLGIASNKPDAFVDRIVRTLEIDDVIRAACGGDRARKPDPEQIRILEAACGMTGASRWMIGDHRTDLAVAANCGLRAIWCSWGIGVHDDLPYVARADHPRDVCTVIGQAVRSGR